jgi:hypothetical protein
MGIFNTHTHTLRHVNTRSQLQGIPTIRVRLLLLGRHLPAELIRPFFRGRIIRKKTQQPVDDKVQVPCLNRSELSRVFVCVYVTMPVSPSVCVCVCLRTCVCIFSSSVHDRPPNVTYAILYVILYGVVQGFIYSDILGLESQDQ